MVFKQVKQLLQKVFSQKEMSSFPKSFEIQLTLVLCLSYLIDADMTFILGSLLQKFFIFLNGFFFDCYFVLHSFYFLLAFLQGSFVIFCLLIPAAKK